MKAKLTDIGISLRICCLAFCSFRNKQISSMINYLSPHFRFCKFWSFMNPGPLQSQGERQCGLRMTFQNENSLSHAKKIKFILVVDKLSLYKPFRAPRCLSFKIRETV